MLKAVVRAVDTGDRCSKGDESAIISHYAGMPVHTLIASHFPRVRPESVHEKANGTRKHTVSRQDVC